jgi:hypothetical protein
MVADSISFEIIFGDESLMDIFSDVKMTGGSDDDDGFVSSIWSSFVKLGSVLDVVVELLDSISSFK